MIDIKKISWFMLAAFFVVAVGFEMYDGKTLTNPLGTIGGLWLSYVCFKKSIDK
jgi:hypothetical protein